MMESFQDGQNGPLSEKVRKRMRTVRDALNFSWAEMGDAFDFSNTFVHGLAREEIPQRIRSKHVDKLIRDLESLEVRAGIRDVADLTTAINRPIGPEDHSLEYLISAITAKGFNVTFSPAPNRV